MSSTLEKEIWKKILADVGSVFSYVFRPLQSPTPMQTLILPMQTNRSFRPKMRFFPSTQYIFLQ